MYKIKYMSLIQRPRQRGAAPPDNLGAAGSECAIDTGRELADSATIFNLLLSGLDC